MSTKNPSNPDHWRQSRVNDLQRARAKSLNISVVVMPSERVSHVVHDVILPNWGNRYTLDTWGDHHIIRCRV